jgi:hypothetical protein
MSSLKTDKKLQVFDVSGNKNIAKLKFGPQSFVRKLRPIVKSTSDG